MKRVLLFLFVLIAFECFAKQDSILTKQGYKRVSLCRVGDSVLAYDVFTGRKFYNAINKIDTVVPVSQWEDSVNGVPVFNDINFYTINNKYIFYGEQLLWANTGIRHVKQLSVGDTIFNDKNNEVHITSIAAQVVSNKIWYRFEISGDHSFIEDQITLHNSSLYWGQASGNSNDGTKWCTDTISWISASSVPSSGDNAIFTKAAGSVSCAMNANFYCYNFDCHGWQGGFTGNSMMQISGNMYLHGVMPWSSVFLMNTSGTATVQSNGSFFVNGSAFWRYGSGGTTDFVDSCWMNSLYFNAGTVQVDAPIAIVGIGMQGTSPCGMTLIGSVNLWLLYGNISFYIAGGSFSLKANQSTIHISGNNSTFDGDGLAFYNVVYYGSSGSTIAHSNTFNNLKFQPSGAASYSFTAGTTQTVMGDFIAKGGAGKVITIVSTSSVTGANISVCGTIGCSNDYIKNGTLGMAGISRTGTGIGFLGANSTSVGTNSGWLYSAGSGCSACSTVAILRINGLKQGWITNINSIVQSTGINKVNGVIDH